MCLTIAFRVRFVCSLFELLLGSLLGDHTIQDLDPSPHAPSSLLSPLSIAPVAGSLVSDVLYQSERNL